MGCSGDGVFTDMFFFADGVLIEMECFWRWIVEHVFADGVFMEVELLQMQCSWICSVCGD